MGVSIRTGPAQASPSGTVLAMQARPRLHGVALAAAHGRTQSTDVPKGASSPANHGPAVRRAESLTRTTRVRFPPETSCCAGGAWDCASALTAIVGGAVSTT